MTRDFHEKPWSHRRTRALGMRSLIGWRTSPGSSVHHAEGPGPATGEAVEGGGRGRIGGEIDDQPLVVRGGWFEGFVSPVSAPPASSPVRVASQAQAGIGQTVTSAQFSTQGSFIMEHATRPDRTRTSRSSVWAPGSSGADWGDVGEDDALRRADAARRRRRDLPRHRRRVRRRPQRAARRPAAPRATRRRHHRRHQDGPPGRPQVPRDVHARQLPRLDRPLPAPTSASTPSTWSSCTARRPPCSRTDARLRRARHAGRGEARSPPTASASRPVDEALTAIARPDVAQRADHPQRVPAQAARRRCCRPRQTAGVGIIARVPLASGLLSGQVRRAHHLRRRRPPHLQPARRGVRRRRDVLRRGLRHRARGPRAGSPLLAPAGRDDGPVRAALDRRPARRQHGHPGRPQRRTRPGPTPPPPTCPAARRRCCAA